MTPSSVLEFNFNTLCVYNYFVYMYKVVFRAIQYDSALDQKHCVFMGPGYDTKIDLLVGPQSIY